MVNRSMSEKEKTTSLNISLIKNSYSFGSKTVFDCLVPPWWQPIEVANILFSFTGLRISQTWTHNTNHSDLSVMYA